MKPPVSLCVPCYNNPAGVRRVLNSIVAQSFTDFECIITDDSTDDKTKEIVEPFLSDGRFAYHHNPQPLGSPENWNYCVSLASGDYIKLLHHDDWFSAGDALQQLYDCAMRFPESGFIACGCRNCDTAGRPLGAPVMPDARFLKRLARDRTGLFYANKLRTPSATLIRRDVFQPFDPSLIWLVDLEQYMRVLEKTSLAFLPVALVNVTATSPGQVSRRCERSLDINLREHVYVARKLWGARIPLRASLHLARVLARTLRDNGAFLKMPAAACALLPLALGCLGLRDRAKSLARRLQRPDAARHGGGGA